MNVRDYVQGLDLKLNQQYRGNCPACNGKGTFTATMTMEGTKYNCFKAGCKTFGFMSDGLNADQLKAVFHARLAGEIDMTYTPTPISVPEGFTKQIPDGVSLPHLNVDTHDLYYDVKRERLCVPVKWRGHYVDFVGRSMNGQQPKWLRYSDAHVPYTFGTGRCCVLVEDVLSAIAAGESSGCVGVALLGTNVIKEYMPVILGYNKIIVALDPDARLKALGIVKELRSKHKHVLAMNLQDDLKYRTATDVANLKVLSER